VAKEPIVFEVSLANPYAFPGELCGLEIVTESVDFRGETTGVVMPAFCREMVVQLYGMPQDAGKLLICGCKFSLLGIQFQIMVSEGGYVDKPSEGIEVEVIGPQPVLRAPKPTSVDGNSLFLLEGEVKIFGIILENFGSQPINYLKVKINHQHAKMKKTAKQTIGSALFESDDRPFVMMTKIESILPIKSSATCLFRVTGKKGW
jgi:hypothetical protein